MLSYVPRRYLHQSVFDLIRRVNTSNSKVSKSSPGNTGAGGKWPPSVNSILYLTCSMVNMLGKLNNMKLGAYKNLKSENVMLEVSEKNEVIGVHFTDPFMVNISKEDRNRLFRMPEPTQAKREAESEGGDLGLRNDLFAMGVILYEFATGQIIEKDGISPVGRTPLTVSGERVRISNLT